MHDRTLRITARPQQIQRSNRSLLGLPGAVPSSDTSIHTVIGKAIQMPLIPADDADVKKYHVYVEALVALYDNHKAQYGRA